jgi:hypothetical protein
MALASSFGLCMDGLQHVLIDSLDEWLIHLGKSFNYIICNAVNIMLFDRGNIIYERLNALTRCKERSYRLIDHKIGGSDSAAFVCEVHQAK